MECLQGLMQVKGEVVGTAAKGHDDGCHEQSIRGSSIRVVL
jgi:hypothetical protein